MKGLLQGLLKRRQKQRVVITGIGIISPLGNNRADFWQNLCAGKTGVQKITLFDATTFPTQIAAEVKDFVPEQYMSSRKAKLYSRATQFALAASNEAMKDADLQSFNKKKTDVIIGSGICSMNVIENEVFKSENALAEFSPATLDPAGMIKAFIAAPSCAIALQNDVKGYVSSITSACSSAINAIGLAAERIQDGRADVAIAGGVDTPISPFILNAYCIAKFLTTNNDLSSLCPFDQRRTKAVLGEGSAIFVLEELNHALARGASYYCEIKSFAQKTENTNELYFLDHSAVSWSELLKDLVDNEPAIDYINAHGPSDKAIDRAEVKALTKVFAKKAYEIPLTSIKGAIGSGIASAGSFQAASAAISIKEQTLPPTFNYEQPDPEIPVNVVINNKRREKRKINNILVNSHAIGGINSGLILSKVS